MGVPDELIGFIAKKLMESAVDEATKPQQDDDENTKELKRMAREGDRSAIKILNDRGIFEFD